jgi:D-amino-acid dehydrogenase
MEIGRLDLKVNPARLRGMRGAVAKYFPAFAGADLETPPVWTGLRPCSPDGLPYIGRWRSVQNLTIATGHAMMGVTLAPVTGSLVAAAIDDDENPLLDVVRPDRFA